MFIAQMMGSDFVDKIIQKYSVEFVLTLFFVKLLSYLINSKLYLTVLYVSRVTSSPLFTYLYSPIINHKLFNTLYELKSKTYLKYVKNLTNRAELEILIDRTLLTFLSKDSFLTAINVKILLFSTKSEFLNSLIKELEVSRSEQTHVIRKLVTDKKVHRAFANKYIAWTDMIYQCTIDRVKDLLPNDYNNYKSFIQFLYIINDMIKIYIDQVALNVNVFGITNSEKQVKNKKRGTNESRGRDPKNPEKTNRDRSEAKSTK